MSDNAILAAMRRMGIAKDEMSGHGFRAMARTILDEVLGVRPDLIEHQLAHAVRDPNGRAYNRTAHLPERRKMMQQWADYLDKLKAGAEVIPLHTAPAAPHEPWLVERLKNPKMAAAYLEAAIEDGDQGALMMALRHVAQAQGGVAEMARRSHLSREATYRMLSG